MNKKRILISVFILVILGAALALFLGNKSAKSQDKLEPTTEIPTIHDPVEVQYEVHWLPESEVDSMNQPSGG